MYGIYSEKGRGWLRGVARSRCKTRARHKGDDLTLRKSGSHPRISIAKISLIYRAARYFVRLCNDVTTHNVNMRGILITHCIAVTLTR